MKNISSLRGRFSSVSSRLPRLRDAHVFSVRRRIQARRLPYVRDARARIFARESQRQERLSPSFKVSCACKIHEFRLQSILVNMRNVAVSSFPNTRVYTISFKKSSVALKLRPYVLDSSDFVMCARHTHTHTHTRFIRQYRPARTASEFSGS